MNRHSRKSSKAVYVCTMHIADEALLLRIFDDNKVKLPAVYRNCLTSIQDCRRFLLETVKHDIKYHTLHRLFNEDAIATIKTDSFELSFVEFRNDGEYVHKALSINESIEKS